MAPFGDGRQPWTLFIPHRGKKEKPQIDEKEGRCASPERKTCPGTVINADGDRNTRSRQVSERDCGDPVAGGRTGNNSCSFIAFETANRGPGQKSTQSRWRQNHFRPEPFRCGLAPLLAAPQNRLPGSPHRNRNDHGCAAHFERWLHRSTILKQFSTRKNPSRRL